MAAPTKPALETFLTNVKERTSAPAESDGKGVAAAGRLVILTILSQGQTPMPEAELVARSELNREWYDATIRELETDGLIERGDAGFVLTPRGREAAERDRSKLLSPW